jgi:hypothetical protein
MLSLLPPSQIDFEPNTLEINNAVPKDGEIAILKDGRQ